MREIPCSRQHAGFTLVELLVSSSVGLMMLAGLVSAAVAIQKSISATNHYVAAVNNGDRLIDYVSQDLRRAVRVGGMAGGIRTSLKNNASFGVTEENVLTISIPDYYASNIPNNAVGSGFKLSRYARITLNTETRFNTAAANSPLNGCVPWSEAVMKVGSLQTPRFAPAAGNNEIEVRYYRGPRSAHDHTVCFFRAEYLAGSNVPNSVPREIAERVARSESITTLIVTAPNLATSDPGYGKTFMVQSNFTPKYGRLNGTTPGTGQCVKVLLRNARRD